MQLISKEKHFLDGNLVKGAHPLKLLRVVVVAWRGGDGSVSGLLVRVMKEQSDA